MDLKTTSMTELHEHEEAKDLIWVLRAVYDLDRKKILEWLHYQAKTSLSLEGVGNTDKARQMRAVAINKYETWSGNLESLYNVAEIAVNDKLYQEAQNGEIKEKTPTTSIIRLWMGSFFMIGGAESVLFSYLVFGKGAGYMLLVIAIVLFLGGLVAGWAIAKILSEKEKAKDKQSKYKVEGKYIAYFGIGIALVAACVGARFFYGGPLAGVVAVVIGLGVITTEVLWKYHGYYRTFCLDRMFQAQVQYSAKQLRVDLGVKGNYEDDTFRKDYKQYVNDISGIYED